ELLTDRRTTTLELRKARKPVVIFTFSLRLARPFPLLLFELFLNRFVIETVIREEICILTSQHRPLQIGRDLVQWHPGLFTLRLLALCFCLFDTRVDQRRR